ncbi:hypothetical protein CKO25_13875 [Thiocapsa imhoffii]|uniref:Diguanylate cyclase n=2 Tax=Thiocapsa imhoffii TaxID=382777 RepID=A0A9X0WJK0_9GAMM|nr:hypothetical protein [Thiocapsa imhoffii]
MPPAGLDRVGSAHLEWDALKRKMTYQAPDRRVGRFGPTMTMARSAIEVMRSAQTAKILIVDDVATNIEVLLGILEPDYDVSFATSGRHALDLLAKGARPDLILLDVMMPEMDGYAVCAALKADSRTRAIPIIFVTGKTDAESETQALDAGGVDFIHKPVNSQVVRSRVRLHLELQRRTRELERSLIEVAAANDRLRVLTQAIQHSPASIVITGLDGTIQYVNPAFVEETGYSLVEAVGRNPRLLKSGLNDPATYRSLWEHLQRGEPWVGELINRRKTGEIYSEEAHIAPVKDVHGEVTHYVAVKLNITERKRSQERLTYLATHDALTKLPNRALFFEHLDRALALARRNRTRLALLFIDLDHFKPVNDTLGHAVGDRLLQQAARRMASSLRDADTVGRIGGDEFVALLTGLDTPENARLVAEKLRDAVRRPYDLAGQTVRISASVGVAIFPDHGDSSLVLARHADDAMYLAKQQGRDGVVLFDPTLIPTTGTG